MSRRHMGYATFTQRFGAHVIDNIIFFIIFMVISHSTYIDESELALYIFACARSISPVLYSILFHAKFGQTLGKMKERIQVIDVSEERPITFRQALIRDSFPLLCSFGYIILLVLGYTEQYVAFGKPLHYFLYYGFYVWLALEVITMLFNKKRRAIHDYMAGTVVVRIRSKNKGPSLHD